LSLILRLLFAAAPRFQHVLLFLNFQGFSSSQIERGRKARQVFVNAGRSPLSPPSSSFPPLIDAHLSISPSAYTTAVAFFVIVDLIGRRTPLPPSVRRGNELPPMCSPLPTFLPFRTPHLFFRRTPARIRGISFYFIVFFGLIISSPTSPCQPPPTNRPHLQYGREILSKR